MQIIKIPIIKTMCHYSFCFDFEILYFSDLVLKQQNLCFFVKMWVPRHDPTAQYFKPIGTLIPRYTIIKYHFLTLVKIIYQK